jgi:type VII secretion-associated protein (TIGR03931 family)
MDRPAVTDAVVEAGPEQMAGPNPLDEKLVSAALECIDDDFALVDDRPVAVADLWREVIGDAVGGRVDRVVLIVPSWWSTARVDCVHTAALSVASTVSLLTRTEVLADGHTTILEVARELVVVNPASGPRTVVARRGDVGSDADTVVSVVGAGAPVLVDAPATAQPFTAAVLDRLRATGIAVAVARHDAVLVAHPTGDAESVTVEDARLPRSRRGAAVIAGITSAVLLCAAFAMRGGPAESAAHDIPMTLLVEGRVGVMVPAVWPVQRITSGPGSARVQIVSSTEPDVALQLTQSVGPAWGRSGVVDSLRAALQAEPAGVFVDFNASDDRAGKPAVTYRERRPNHYVDWVVLIDGEVRIAIGCQSAPGREQLIRDVCDRAVRSAHAIF